MDKVKRARRRGLVFASVSAAAVFIVASAAFACTNHSGNLYFCSQNTTLCSSVNETTSLTAGSTYYLSLNGMEWANSAYTTRYITATGDVACMASLDGWGTYTTDGSGNYFPITAAMPPAGSYRACATTEKVTNPGPEGPIYSSNHKAFTTT